MRSTTTILILLCALGCVSCIFPSYQVEKHEEEPKKRTAVLADYKLPDNIEPIHYGIKLIPYMDEAPYPKNFTFDGDISITIKVLKATDMIRMHAHDLTIYHDAVSVTNEGSGEKQNITSVKQTEPDDDRQFLDIFLENELEENTYTIKIHFEGTLNSDLAGFYRSGYKENNKQKWMLVTQFEPTAARRAFPCFDEPALKATYDVSIARRKGWTVLSNMPQNDQLRKPLPRQKGYTWVYFKQSLKMSSYLVAFAVSQFKSITSPIDARFKVWARPELIHTGKYAADVAPKVVQCLENRTNHKYDLPKSDHIAVQDFEYGAMENWGLITYRETALLYNEENSTTYSKQATASVIAHELAHQWFGNLVSPKWWSNLWLNEGFATFLANYIGSCVEPKMAFMEQFLTAPLARALEKDALEDAHPLVVPVASPSEIKAIFDGISYSKGGSVIRMMHSILGEENFWKGLRAYIEKMQFSNADQNDLWRGLSTAVPNGLLPNNVEFKDIMDTWALQAGYPVVTVTRDYDKNTVSFTQKRFFSSAPVKKEHNEVYWVPLTMLVQGEPKENGNNITWLYNKTITMASPSSDKWILVNNEKNGYYRVNYDKENWKKLSESINGAQLVNTLSVNNRVQLLLDSFALAKAKVLDYEPALLMTNYLNYETELTPWNAVLDEFNYIYDRMIGDESLMTMFENFLKSKMSHLYEHVNGFGASESDEHPLRLLRIRVVVWLCEMGYEACNKDASALFNQWKTSNVKIHPDLKRTVLKTGMRMGGEDEYNFLYKKYKESTDLSKYTYLIAMAASKDKDILSRMLRDSIAEQSPFKTEDALTIINMVRANPVGTDLALDFVITNYFNATKQWGNGGYAFLYLVGSLNTDDQKQKITNFLQSHNATLTEAARANIKYTLTTLEKNMQWNSEFKETFAKFVGPYDSSGDGSNGLLIALFAIIVLIALAFGLKKFFLDKQNNGIILRS